MFSKKATKIEKISPSIWHLLSKCQINSEDLINFCGLLKNMTLISAIHSTIFLWRAVKNGEFPRFKPRKIQFQINLYCEWFWFYHELFPAGFVIYAISFLWHPLVHQENHTFTMGPQFKLDRDSIPVFFQYIFCKWQANLFRQHKIFLPKWTLMKIFLTIPKKNFY